MSKKLLKVRKVVLSLLIPVLIIGMWYYTTNFTEISKSIMPPLSKIGKSFLYACTSGQMWGDLSVSFSRIVKGYLGAVVLGGLLGIAMGMSQIMKELFTLVTTCIRQIPMMAWVPMIILWCGIGEQSKVVVIIIAAFFPIMVNTYHGIITTPDTYLELADLYNLSKWEKFWKVYLPHALPSVLVGLKLGISTSWMAVVGAEMISASSGIGFRMSDSRSKVRADMLLSCMLVVGFIGLLMDKGLEFLFGKLTPWERKEKK